MVDRTVPGYAPSAAFVVTPTEVAAAKLKVERARERGAEVDPAIEAIANALPASALNGDGRAVDSA